MVADGGYSIQIVHTESHRFVLDENALASVLLREDIQQLPVVLVSVAGAYRGGKSFLLNFFLRYLMAPQPARDDGSWLRTGGPLEGFSWRCGTTRNTTGIQMWSEPFICKTSSGDKVAVFLMDTQGMFNSSSTMEDCTKIFALSTLLCSVQIYNLSQKIQEDHLQHLHLFTEYARLAQDQGHGKAFQTLTFLIRDWQNAWEYEYGTVGGNQFLESLLQINDGMPKEIKEVREHIHSCFDKVSCFLMPYPGLIVDNPDFRGELTELTDDFQQHVKDLVDSIFKTVNLTPKIVNGNMITSNELYTYFKSYMSTFSSGEMPFISNIMQVTTEANLLTAKHEVAEHYEYHMESKCGNNISYIPTVDLEELHKWEKEKAIKNFAERKLMGSSKTIEYYKKQLSKDIDGHAPKYLYENAKKLQAVIEDAKKAYDDIIKGYSQEDVICVHPNDLESIHTRASSAALNTFDARVRRITNKPDGDREWFKEIILDNEHELLNKTNERSNTQLVNDLCYMYQEHMLPKVLVDPALFPTQLKREHDVVFERVMESFDQMRKCLADSYPKDIYKDRLKIKIDNYYNDISVMNDSVYGREINAAFEKYKAYVNRHWNQQKEHLHPDDLTQLHEAARAAAKKFVFGNHNQDMPEEDGIHLEKMISTLFSEFKETNEVANRQAMQSAYNLFISTLQEKRSAKGYDIFIIPKIINKMANLIGIIFQQSKREAIKEFYKNRKWSKCLENTDIYYKELLKKIDDEAPAHLDSLMCLARKCAAIYD